MNLHEDMPDTRVRSHTKINIRYKDKDKHANNHEHAIKHINKHEQWLWIHATIVDLGMKD